MFQARRFWNGYACKCMVGDDNQRFKCMLDVVGELSKRTAVLFVYQVISSTTRLNDLVSSIHNRIRSPVNS